MEKIKSIGQILSKNEQKRIKGGNEEEPPSCYIGKTCYNWYTHTNGICYPDGSRCFCVVGSAGVYSLECTADA